MKTNIQIKNRFSDEIIFEYKCNTMKDCIEKAISKKVNLRDAYLRDADLEMADLEGADLEEADLRGAYLRDANLEMVNLVRANLREADLKGANLKGANLVRANLDFSCMSFHCNHLKPKTDRKLRVQLCYHLASWMKNADNLDEDEKKILAELKDYANEFHREEVERI